MEKSSMAPISQSNKKSLDHLFPESTERRKMSLIFACLSCLICLMMLAISAGIRTGEHWGEAFERNYVLELRPISEVSAEEQLETAIIILKDDPNIADIRVIRGTDLEEIMAPWLGDNISLEGLPLSQLIEIEMIGGDIKSALHVLKKELVQVPGASVEAYHEVKAEFKAAGSALHLVSMVAALILLIIVGAVTAVSVESSVLDNKKIVNVLRLIGTENQLIIQLFIQKILIYAIKGTLVGVLIACSVIAFTSLVGTMNGLETSFIFNGFIPSIEVLLLLLCVPITIIIVGYLSGRRTMQNMLQEFI